MKKEEDLETKKTSDIELFQIDLYHTSIDDKKREGKLYFNGEYVCDTIEFAMETIYQRYQRADDKVMDSLFKFGKPNPKDNWFVKKGTYQLNMRKNLPMYAGIAFYKMLPFGIPYLEGATQGTIEFGFRVLDAKVEIFNQGIFIADRMTYINLYDKIASYEDGYITIH